MPTHIIIRANGQTVRYDYAPDMLIAYKGNTLIIMRHGRSFITIESEQEVLVAFEH